MESLVTLHVTGCTQIFTLCKFYGFHGKPLHHDFQNTLLFIFCSVATIFKFVLLEQICTDILNLSRKYQLEKCCCRIENRELCFGSHEAWDIMLYHDSHIKLAQNKGF